MTNIIKFVPNFIVSLFTSVSTGSTLIFFQMLFGFAMLDLAISLFYRLVGRR